MWIICTRLLTSEMNRSADTGQRQQHHPRRPGLLTSEMNRSADTPERPELDGTARVADVGNEPIGGHFIAFAGIRTAWVADVGNEPIGGHHGYRSPLTPVIMLLTSEMNRSADSLPTLGLGIPCSIVDIGNDRIDILFFKLVIASTRVR